MKSLILLLIATASISKAEPTEKWKWERRIDSSVCDNCIQYCLVSITNPKISRCSKVTLPDVNDVAGNELLHEKLQTIAAAMKASNEFELPEDNFNFYKFSNKFTSSPSFCNSSSEFFDRLVEARRTCPSGSSSSTSSKKATK